MFIYNAIYGYTKQILYEVSIKILIELLKNTKWIVCGK